MITLALVAMSGLPTSEQLLLAGADLVTVVYLGLIDPWSKEQIKQTMNSLREF